MKKKWVKKISRLRTQRRSIWVRLCEYRKGLITIRESVRHFNVIEKARDSLKTHLLEITTLTKATSGTRRWCR